MATKKSKKSNTVTKGNAAALVVAALLVGWTAGYVLAEVTGDDSATSDTAGTNELASHAHELFEVEVANAPQVQLIADEDELGGWNITLVTKNFEFTPTDVNEDDVAGTGHAHIWVDGEKMGRVYGNYYHLPSLGEGEHEITVTLNTNSHRDYAVEGEEVRATIEITEGASQGDGHSDHEDHDDHETHSAEEHHEDEHGEQGHMHE